MTTSPTLLLVILIGAAVGGGVLLLVHALTPRPAERVAAAPSQLLAQLKGAGRTLPLAIGAGLLVLLLTQWIVVALACAALVLFWDRLFGGTRAAREGVARIEALAAWTESLRDTVAGAVGLEQAIPATAHAASPAIASDLFALSDRLRVRVPLPMALQRFADDMDDSGADLIIAALILNSRLRGPGLRGVLTSLAGSARQELEMRQRVNAGRRSTQRSVQIVVGVTIAFVVGLALFNPAYVEPYGSPVGQLVLLVVLAFFAAGIMWLRRLSVFEAPERFLRSLDAKGRD
ncbi:MULTISPECIES: type II secretion system F family protein [unclassified Nocardioides]|uniref:type II secretion system F family protein n=1 Tax=unclassified Nocardioides TaxID=2615069 RepID=UPI00070032C0|nr:MULTISPECIES: type II secretion system F family protein [unclassified Nocardioides]KQY64683.1 type II secretion system protein [Nocardioides sp. Root140]KQZ67336.1 type II secretion system protein [Nocardioides sp. Root151]KRF12586.1 type II secretion system protein [Nocardioides sp. Soil796]